MNIEREKWIEDVFQSIKGSQRAKPRSELLISIQEKIADSKSKNFPLHHLRYAVAAAVLVLVLNIFAVFKFTQNIELNDSEMIVSSENYNQSIFSNYNIYE